MSFLFDFLPIVFFFIAYKLYGIYVATALAMAVSLAQVFWQWFRYKRIETNQLLTLFLVTACGGATLFFHNAIFIKWKPTAIYWAFAAAFTINQYFGKQLFVQRLMESQLKLAPIVWQRVQTSWIVFFTGMGFLNLYILYHFNTDTWVNFKLFGTGLLTLAFVTVQAIYMTRRAINQ